MSYSIDTDKEKFLDGLCKDLSDDYDINDYLNEKIKYFQKRGFFYFDTKEDFFKPIDISPFVLMPSGIKLTLPKIARRLRKLEAFNYHQIEAIVAWKVWMINNIYLNGF